MRVRHTRGRSLLGAALLAVLALAGCSGDAEPLSGSTGSAAIAAPLAQVRPLPATVDGAKFDPATLRGKPVVLWFWAPWCPVCRSEAAGVARVATEFADRVHFVGVAGQDTTAAMKSFVAQTGVSRMPHLADTAGTIWRDYGVSVQPSYAFISTDGRADVRVGGLDEATLRARVAEVAAGAATSTISKTPGPSCSKGADGTLYCSSSGPVQTLAPGTATSSAP